MFLSKNRYTFLFTLVTLLASLLAHAEPVEDTPTENIPGETVFNFAKAGFENYKRRSRIALGKPVYNGVLSPFICRKKEDAKLIIEDLKRYGELPPITMKSVAYGIRDEMRLTAKRLEQASCYTEGEVLDLLRQKYIVRSTHFDEYYIQVRLWPGKEVYYLPAFRSEGIVFTIQRLLPAKIPESEFSKRRTPCPKSVKCQKLNDGL